MWNDPEIGVEWPIPGRNGSIAFSKRQEMPGIESFTVQAEFVLYQWNSSKNSK